MGHSRLFMASEIVVLTTDVSIHMQGLILASVVNSRRENRIPMPSPSSFKEQSIDAFYQGIKHKRTTTFGQVEVDIIKDPTLYH